MYQYLHIEPQTDVIAGLDPAIHLLRKELLRETMDPRVKPAGDVPVCGSSRGPLIPIVIVGLDRLYLCHGRA